MQAYFELGDFLNPLQLEAHWCIQVLKHKAISIHSAD